MERRSVRSCYHGSKSSESQQSFLAETAICIVERWKKGLQFCSWVQLCTGKVIHVIFVIFFLPHLQGHRLLRSRNFATLSTSCNDFSTVLIFFFPLKFFFLARKTEGFSWPTRLHWLQVLYEYQGISSCVSVRWSCRILVSEKAWLSSVRFVQVNTGYSKGGRRGKWGIKNLLLL